MRKKNKRLSILSEAEQFALYALPNFDEEQRFTYLTFTEAEQSLIQSRPSLSAQIYCGLQIGYFKAKQFFFYPAWEEIPEEDILFVVEHYFSPKTWHPKPIHKNEYYAQRTAITLHFGYKSWSASHQTTLLEKLQLIARQDVTLPFLLSETLAWLNEQHILRPGYTALQDVISQVIQTERQRLNTLVATHLTEENKAKLNQLLATETQLSELAALKQEAKDFKYRMM